MEDILGLETYKLLLDYSIGDIRMYNRGKISLNNLKYSLGVGLEGLSNHICSINVSENNKKNLVLPLIDMVSEKIFESENSFNNFYNSLLEHRIYITGLINSGSEMPRKINLDIDWLNDFRKFFPKK